jgi:hypothetical protein
MEKSRSIVAAGLIWGCAFVAGGVVHGQAPVQAPAQNPAQAPAQAPVRLQERQAVAGTTVSLTPPPGFVPATQFAGFVNEALQAAILVVELPLIGYADMSELFKDLTIAKSLFAHRGVEVSGLEEVDAGDAKIPLVVGTQVNDGMTYRKWIALFKGNKAVMITVQAPDAQTPGGPTLDGAVVKAMLTSVSFSPEPTITEKLKALPFTIEARAPFRIIDTLLGAAVMMTVGERDVDPSNSQPSLIVSYQISAPIPPDRLDETAEQLLMQTRGFTAARIVTRERVPFAGTTGVRLAGTYSDGDRPKRVVQYMAIGENGRYIRFIADTNERDFEQLQPAIAAIAQSVAFK